MTWLPARAWAQATAAPAPSPAAVRAEAAPPEVPLPADDPQGNWPWEQPRSRFVFSLAAGPGYHNMLGASIGGGELALSFGQDRRRFYWGVGLIGGLASTDSGLMTTQLALEAGFLGVIQRLRLGGGPRLGWVTVDRVTTDARFQLLSIGLVGTVSVDVVSDGERTFAIGLYPSWEGLITPKLFELGAGSAGLYGVTARLAVRWRGGA